MKTIGVILNIFGLFGGSFFFSLLSWCIVHQNQPHYKMTGQDALIHFGCTFIFLFLMGFVEAKVKGISFWKFFTNQY